MGFGVGFSITLNHDDASVVASALTLSGSGPAGEIFAKALEQLAAAGISAAVDVVASAGATVLGLIAFALGKNIELVNNPNGVSIECTWPYTGGFFFWAQGNSASVVPPPVYSWVPLPGAATDIGVGADGRAWVLGTNANPTGDFGIYSLGYRFPLGFSWDAVDGGGVRIAVGPDGMPWIVNSQHAIYRRTTAGWEPMPAAAMDIGVGGDGSVWVLGTNANPAGDFGIYRWDGTGWNAIDGGGVRIAVGPDGMPWIVNSQHAIYRRTTAGWELMPGAGMDIGVGADGSVWVLGTNANPAGDFEIFRLENDNWVVEAGGGVDLAVGPDGQPRLIDSQGHIAVRVRIS